MQLISVQQLLFLSPPLLYLTLCIFGLFLGSFFKVVVDRSRYIYDPELDLNTSSSDISSQSSWKTGRSRCDHCQASINWYDNIPLLSFILLKARCRQCGISLSWSYPITELLTGLIFALAGYLAIFFPLFSSPLLSLIWLILVLSTIWLIFLFDWQYMVIPDELVVMTALLATVKVIFSNQSLSSTLITAVSLLVFFLLLRFLPLWFIQRPGMGWGDIKLIFPLAVLLGYPSSLIAVFCAFIIGGVWGIILFITKRAKTGQALSFGPFLVMGTVLALIWGEQLWHAYWSLM